MAKKSQSPLLTSVYFSGNSYYVRVVPHHVDTESLGFPHGISMLPTHTIDQGLSGDELQSLHEIRNNEAKQQAIQTQELLIKLILEFKRTPKELWQWTKKTNRDSKIWLSLNVPEHLKDDIAYEQLVFFATPCKSQSEADEFDKRICRFLDKMAIRY